MLTYKSTTKNKHTHTTTLQLKNTINSTKINKFTFRANDIQLSEKKNPQNNLGKYRNTQKNSNKSYTNHKRHIELKITKDEHP
jgi:hypothetical protein